MRKSLPGKFFPVKKYMNPFFFVSHTKNRKIRVLLLLRSFSRPKLSKTGCSRFLCAIRNDSSINPDLGNTGTQSNGQAGFPANGPHFRFTRSRRLAGSDKQVEGRSREKIRPLVPRVTVSSGSSDCRSAGRSRPLILKNARFVTDDFLFPYLCNGKNQAEDRLHRQHSRA